MSLSYRVFASVLVAISVLVSSTSAIARSPQEIVKKMSLEEKVGQLFVINFYGQDADASHPKNRELNGVSTIREAIRRYHVGGVIYFGFTGNIDNLRQVAHLSNQLQEESLKQSHGIPLQIAADQEGGYVSRFPFFSPFPGAMAIAATGDLKDACAAATVTGRELRAVGVNDQLGPVADVNSEPANPVIGTRSFGEDVDFVAKAVAEQVRCYHEAGVATTAKHFPGHGDTHTDSHSELPVVSHSLQKWKSTDRPPFAAAIASGVDSIMTAHVSVPALDRSGDPATLSKAILQGQLRDELGFDGVIKTDALDMAGVRKRLSDDQIAITALKAGADELVMPPNLESAFNAIVNAVRENEISEARIDESVIRILKLKQKRGILPNDGNRYLFADEEAAAEAVGNPSGRAVAQGIADRGITLVSRLKGALPLPAGKRVFVTCARLPGSQDERTTNVLTKQLHDAGLRAEGKSVSNRPDSAEIAEMVKSTRDFDAVVVGTMRAASVGEQRALVSELSKLGKPVIVAALREPYDTGHFPNVAANIAAYSNNPAALEAVAKLLSGRMSPSGRLPVRVPNGPLNIQQDLGYSISSFNCWRSAGFPPARRAQLPRYA